MTLRSNLVDGQASPSNQHDYSLFQCSVAKTVSRIAMKATSIVVVIRVLHAPILKTVLLPQIVLVASVLQASVKVSVYLNETLDVSLSLF